jgi:transcriptional regulator with XRE-family HTH domain
MGQKRPVMRPSEVLARQMAAIRERRRWSQQQLADRLAELGMPMDRTVIAKLENATRRVTLDEAFALAAALGVSPANLFLPLEAGTDVAIAPKLAVLPRAARAWVRGQQPLHRDDARTFYTEVSDVEWVGMQQSGIRFLLQHIQDLIDATVEQDSDKAIRAVDEINDEMARQRKAAVRFGDAGTATDTMTVERR